jgi:hypothetical protein
MPVAAVVQGTNQESLAQEVLVAVVMVRLEQMLDRRLLQI